MKDVNYYSQCHPIHTAPDSSVQCITKEQKINTITFICTWTTSNGTCLWKIEGQGAEK